MHSTRPCGATFRTLLTNTPAKGGLGLGHISSLAVLLVVLITLGFWTRKNHRRIAGASVGEDVRPA